MKKSLKSLTSLLLMVTMLVTLFAGCSKKADTDVKSDATTTTAPTEAAATPIPVDPMGKYEEPITVTTFFEIAPPIASVFTEERIINNEFHKQYLSELGINIEYLWFAPQSEEDSVQKKNIAIASGDIPDFMMVSKEQLALLAKSDLINKDLGSLFDQYASENLKEWMYQEGDSAMLSATYEGMLAAIPYTDSSIDTAPFMWIRQDWLKNLGLEVPKTMDDLYKVMVAFKNDDPDKNGKADTMGIILQKDLLTTASADGIGIFNGFNAFPRAWVKDASGKLVYGSVMPEVKEALAFLNKLYTEGLIEEDFAVKDVPKVAEIPAAGTAGLQFGAMWNAMWPLQGSKDNDSNADWIGVEIASKDGVNPHPQIRLNVPYYFVINKDAEHPEAVIKLLNFFVEKFGFSTTEEYNKFVATDNGIPSFIMHETIFKTYSALKNLDAYKHIQEVMETNDTSKLTVEEQGYYDSIVKYQGGDNTMTGGYKTFGPEGSFKAMDYYYTNDLFMMDEFFGAPTDTMKQKLQLIQDKEIEYYTKVIMGIEPIDSFDDFVKEINSLGLDKITEEVNEWYTSR